MTKEIKKEPDWRLNFILGIDEIDGQHSRLFDFMDTLDEAIANGAPWLVLHDILEQLHHWTEVHFSVEEALMAILGYPELESHRRAHRAFSNGLNDRRSRVLNNELADDTAEWLRTWLRDHIGVDDRHYAVFFEQRLGVAPTDRP